MLLPVRRMYVLECVGHAHGHMRVRVRSPARVVLRVRARVFRVLRIILEYYPRIFHGIFPDIAYRITRHHTHSDQ